MSALTTFVPTSLAFAPDDTLCKGDRWQLGCASADSEAAYAIHTFEGKHYCAYHSPYGNVYVPCADCGDKPVLAGDPVCADCKSEIPAATDEAPAEEPAGHVCDDTERELYGRYVDDGLADTDGYFAPESFEAWQAHHHRAIGYVEPRTEECTPTECHAPKAERVKYWNAGTRRKAIHTSVCKPCYEIRLADYQAARA